MRIDLQFKDGFQNIKPKKKRNECRNTIVAEAGWSQPLFYYKARVGNLNQEESIIVKRNLIKYGCNWEPCLVRFASVAI